MDELTVFLEKGEAGSRSAVQCWNRGFRLQALRCLEQERGKVVGLWKRRDLIRVLRYRYRLGKEVSLRKKRVRRL